MVGGSVGDKIGDGVGDKLGNGVGDTLGERVGDTLGERVGDTVGERVGHLVGTSVGSGKPPRSELTTEINKRNADPNKTAIDGAFMIIVTERD